MSTERLTPEKVRAALVAADQTTAARESLCIGLVPKPLPSEVLAELCRQLRGALRREHCTSDGTPMCNILSDAQWPSKVSDPDCPQCRVLALMPDDTTEEESH